MSEGKPTGRTRWTCDPSRGGPSGPPYKLQMEVVRDVYLGGDDGWGQRFEWVDAPTDLNAFAKSVETPILR